MTKHCFGFQRSGRRQVTSAPTMSKLNVVATLVRTYLVSNSIVFYFLFMTQMRQRSSGTQHKMRSTGSQNPFYLFWSFKVHTCTVSSFNTALALCEYSFLTATLILFCNHWHFSSSALSCLVTDEDAPEDVAAHLRRLLLVYK